MTNTYEIKYEVGNRLYKVVQTSGSDYAKTGKEYDNPKSVADVVICLMAKGSSYNDFKIDDSASNKPEFNVFYKRVGNYLARAHGYEKSEKREITNEIGKDGIVRTLEASHTTGNN